MSATQLLFLHERMLQSDSFSEILVTVLPWKAISLENNEE